MTVVENVRRGMRRGIRYGLRDGPWGGFTPADLFAGGRAGDYWEPFRIADADDTAYETLAGQLSNHDFTEATEGDRPLVFTRADGVRGLRFAGGKIMEVLSSTGLFKYLHDGSGGTIVAFSSTPEDEVGGAGFIRTATGTSQVGIITLKSAATQTGTFAVCRGVSGQASISMSAPRQMRGGVPMMHVWSYFNGNAADDARIYVDEGRTYTELITTLANQPSTSDASRNLEIMANWNGDLYALLVISKIISSAEILQLFNSWNADIGPKLIQTDLVIPSIGQSLASGRGTLYPVTLPFNENVWMLSKAERYNFLYEPSHDLANQPVATDPTEGSPTAPQFSSLLTTGIALWDDAAIKTNFVPCSIGSTDFTDWDVPGDVGNRGTLFGSAHHRIQKVLNEKGGELVYHLSGFEGSRSLAVADYTNGGVGTGFQDAQESFIDNLRTYVGDGFLLFEQLGADDTLSISEGLAIAAEAQRQYELDNPDTCVMVVKHDVERNTSPDDVHTARGGYEVIGERIPLAIRERVTSGLGRELLVNRELTANKNLTFGTNCSMTPGNPGTLDGVAVPAGHGWTYELKETPAIGDLFQIVWAIIAYTTGGVAPYIGGVNGIVKSAVGTYTEEITATGTQTFRMFRRTTDFTGSVRPLSVRRVLDSNGSKEVVNGTGPKIRMVGGVEQAFYSGDTITLELEKAVNTTAGDYGSMFRVYDNGVEQTVNSANRNASDVSKIDIVCASSLSGPVTLTYGHIAGLASAARTDFVKDNDGLPLPLFGPIAVPAA